MNLSVIIPTLNEEESIHETLSDLFAHHDPDEVILCDGGSTDQTREIASQFPVRFVSSEKGRAAQMNAGVKSAYGDAFVFLHADTKLPKDGLKLIRDAFEEGDEAGRFRMRFDDRSFSLRVYESYTHLHFFSYGDQCFFVKRDLFELLKGYNIEAPFEDIEFYKRLRKMTSPVIIKSPVITSARRFRKVGSMKQKFINLMLVGLYYAGFNVFPLKEKYYTDVR